MLMKTIYWILVFLLLHNTAFNAQQLDSLSAENRHYNFKNHQTYIPLGLMGSALLSTIGGKESLKSEIVEERDEHLFGFRNRLDDYAQFLPHVAVYAMDWAGMKPRTDVQNRSAMMIKGEALTLGLTLLLKKVTNRTRPDGSAYSFPSGHTANAFAGATMLSIEYGERYKWVPYAAYGLASGVGVMRIANNKHYLSDVLFGAGLGILSMKAAYWTHQYRWGKSKEKNEDPMEAVYTK